MLGDTDLTDPNQIEGLRRSVAMLPANTGHVAAASGESGGVDESVVGQDRGWCSDVF